MILSESEKNKIRELHKNRSIIKEQPSTIHCQKCLQDNPTSTAQNCNCPTCPCHHEFDVNSLGCNECYALFWTYQLKVDNCDCIGCSCGDAAQMGCTNDVASNYEANANIDDGSCVFSSGGRNLGIGVWRTDVGVMASDNPTQVNKSTNTDHKTLR